MKMLITSLCFSLCSALILALEFPIPAPNGTYGVGTVAMSLTDTSRLDPLAPKPKPRKLMVSAFYPVAKHEACEWELVEYMPEKTAGILEGFLTQIHVPAGTLASVRLQMCSLENPAAYYQRHPSFLKEQYPLVIFSPGGAQSRLWYSAQAQKIASNGYTVVTIDHSYEATVVEYPDGTIVKANVDVDSDGDPEGYAKLLRIRAKDVSFVLDELKKREVLKHLLPLVSVDVGIDTTNVPMYGHSAGGATAAVVMAKDQRIAGGLNLDGGIEGPVLEKGVKNPYMMWASDWQSYKDPDKLGPLANWSQLWPHLNWGLQIQLKKSHHGTFEDVPYLAHLLGFEPLPKAVTDVLGSLPGDRAMETVTSYVTSFVDFIATGKEQTLLEQPSDDFPEVKFIRQTHT